MNITRQNYEEWLLLYVDNELSLAERIIVDDFLASNPDLQQELEMLQQSTFQPEEDIVFFNKAVLLKGSAQSPLLTEHNCEQYFVLYADDELSNEQKAVVENFVYHHPQFQANFELIQQAKLTPEQSLVFPDKKLLYRYEKDRRVVAMRWYKMVAAAVLVLLIGGVSYKLLVKEDVVTPISSRTTETKAGQENEALAANDSVKAPVIDTALPSPANMLADANGRKKNPPAEVKRTNAVAGQIAVPTIPSPITRPDNRTTPAVPGNEGLANNEAGKKLIEESNNAIASNVTHTEAALTGNEKANTGKINISSRVR